MSKKNKAKFKRQIKNQVLQQMAQQLAPVESALMPNNQSVQPGTAAKIITPQNTAKIVPEIQNLPQIKADLKKTGIVVTILALCILALALLDQKNHLLITFGGWLFKVLHIS